MRKRLKPLIPALLTLGCALGVVLLSFMRPDLLETMDSKAYDLHYLSRDVQPVHPGVILARIDEKSLDVQGRWPWPRARIANLINILSADGARVIGFDIGFLEPDDNPYIRLLDDLDNRVRELDIRDGYLKDLFEQSRKQADNDTVLAEAIRSSSAAVVLGYFFHMADQAADFAAGEKARQSAMGRILSSRYPMVRVSGAGGQDQIISAVAPEASLDILSRATPHAGYFNMAADTDGVVRWLPLAIRCGDGLFPPLSVLCAWLYLERPPLIVNADDYGISSVAMGEITIPTDEQGRMLVNYPGPAGTFPNYSVTDILSNTVPRGTFANAVVIVGVTAMGLNDLRTVPLGPDYPGLEIHASAVSNILARQFMTRSKWALVWDLVCIVLLTMVVGIAIPRLNALGGFAVAAVLAFGVMGATQFLFERYNLWINSVYPLVAVGSTYTVLTLYRYFTETRERMKIKKVFSHYASKDLIEKFVANPEQLKLGGEIKTITVLFCDLANFTDISESRSPHEIVGIMSSYFKTMTEIVYRFKGTLKEYVGDELMALYGAPLFLEDHAVLACNTALAMQEHLAREREKALEKGTPPLTARVGVNTGEMLIGNLGSEYRFSYGALGDNVNLGSRLEGLNKIYGTSIIIGQKTHALVKDQFLVRELDAVRVKGRKTPEHVFELLGRAEHQLPEDQKQAFDHYAQGLVCYRSQKWQEAIDHFEAGQALWNKDKSFDVIIQRCGMYKRLPFQEDWNGVFMERRK
ncbi:MAG: adenylate/guanylate cyclase domain-containing protein [Pseudomonadota bacterium]